MRNVFRQFFSDSFNQFFTQNRRASVVITLESKLIERFPALDRELISGLLLLDTPSTADEGKEPTPAKDATAAATSAANKKPVVKKK